MATKRIQDLENVEEILPDSLIPVGETAKTKSMLISQFKKWLEGFFVSKTGDETISGTKFFELPIKGKIDISNGEKPSSIKTWNLASTNNNGKTVSSFESYVDTSGNVQTIIAARNYNSSGSEVARTALRVYANQNGDTYITSITPLTTDNTTRVATTNFVKNNQGKASSKYDDLELQASETTYTAPANGRYFFQKRSTGNGQFVILSLIDGSKFLYNEESITLGAGNWGGTIMEVKKGQKVKITYTLAGKTEYFRFIYDEGF